MKHELVQEILQCFEDERLVYTFFKDKYCLFHLQKAVEQGLSINELKHGDFKRYCEKKVVKNWLNLYGVKGINTPVTPEMLALFYPNAITETHNFVMTLGMWGDKRTGDWHQKSRHGYNVVLQMNFTKAHDSHYQKVTHEKWSPFEYFGHPIHKGNRKTMAWSRIDLSDDLRVALIEEVQNDWLRRVQRLIKRCAKKHSIA